jgi:hypothetical protein
MDGYIRMVEDQMTNISWYIPIGYENRISRSELSRRTGRTDRMIRKEIEHENRFGGEIIINMGDGYFIPDPVKDTWLLDSYLKREFARMNQIGFKLVAMQEKATR